MSRTKALSISALLIVPIAGILIARSAQTPPPLPELSKRFRTELGNNYPMLHGNDATELLGYQEMYVFAPIGDVKSAMDGLKPGVGPSLSSTGNGFFEFHDNVSHEGWFAYAGRVELSDPTKPYPRRVQPKTNALWTTVYYRRSDYSPFVMFFKRLF